MRGRGCHDRYLQAGEFLESYTRAKGVKARTYLSPGSVTTRLTFTKYECDAVDVLCGTVGNIIEMLLMFGPGFDSRKSHGSLQCVFSLPSPSQTHPSVPSAMVLKILLYMYADGVLYPPTPFFMKSVTGQEAMQ